MQTILVTGGAGYIGSHTCVELLERDYNVIVVDNLCSSSKESLNRVEQISGKSVTFYKLDLVDKPALEKVFEQQKHRSSVQGFLRLAMQYSKWILVY